MALSSPSMDSIPHYLDWSRRWSDPQERGQVFWPIAMIEMSGRDF